MVFRSVGHLSNSLDRRSDLVGYNSILTMRLMLSRKDAHRVEKRVDLAVDRGLTAP